MLPPASSSPSDPEYVGESAMPVDAVKSLVIEFTLAWPLEAFCDLDRATASSTAAAGSSVSGSCSSPPPSLTAVRGRGSVAFAPPRPPRPVGVAVRLMPAVGEGEMSAIIRHIRREGAGWAGTGRTGASRTLGQAAEMRVQLLCRGALLPFRRRVLWHLQCCRLLGALRWLAPHGQLRRAGWGQGTETTDSKRRRSSLPPQQRGGAGPHPHRVRVWQPPPPLSSSWPP